MSYITESLDEEVVRLLQEGGVGFMPSDTIYGLSCGALDKEAVSRLHALKDRSAHKPFIILISNLKMLNLLSIKRESVELAERHWPGALTLICPAPNSPEWLHQGLGTLAVRMPNDQDLLSLINQTGPLVSTSANIEKQPPVSDIREALAIFGDKLDFYVDAGALTGLPSTLVRQTNGKLEVIRQGAVKL